MRAAPAPAGPRPERRRRWGRRAVEWLHRWLGLTAGVVLAVTGLTGSALVFRHEIDTALNPELLRVTPGPQRASLQDVVDRVAARYPADPAPLRIRMPRTPHEPYEVWLGAAPSRYVYADPYTGRILGARRPTEFLTGFLFQLHSKLLAGETGKRVAGACGLALVLLGLSGLVVWWPGRRGLRAAVTVRRDLGWKRTNYDLHRAVGFWASGLLVVAGTTGASLIFHDAFRHAIYQVAGTPAEPAPPAATSPEHLPALSIDRLVADAVRIQPGGAISYVYLPQDARATFRLRQRLPRELHPNGRSMVHLDPRTGAVLQVDDGERAPAGAQVYNALYPIHIGAWGGTATRLVSLVTGLVPALLLVSGVVMWRRRGGGGRRAGDRARGARSRPARRAARHDSSRVPEAC